MSREHLEGCIPSRIMSPWLSSAFGHVTQREYLCVRPSHVRASSAPSHQDRCCMYSAVSDGCCRAVPLAHQWSPGCGASGSTGRQRVLHRSDLQLGFGVLHHQLLLPEARWSVGMVLLRPPGLVLEARAGRSRSGGEANQHLPGRACDCDV
jgi:hypothetical protein